MSAKKISQIQYWNSVTKRRQPTHPVVREFVIPKIRFIEKTIKLKPKSKVLDVGCGSGFFTYYLAKRYQVTGLDFSKKMLALNPHKRLIKASAYQIPFKDNTFDLVFCSNLLHHLDHPLKALKEMNRVAKKFVIASEPNRNNLAILLLGLAKKEERKSLKFSTNYLVSLFKKTKLQIVTQENLGLITPNKTPQSLIKPLLFLEKISWLKPLRAYTIIIAEKKK
ncbi:MAG TPA: methyltransferase domain-containing protein [Patescibacteria group bacterium]|nr:methyltransferase domain-containing protein [Patescibacteria group bacterium]